MSIIHIPWFKSKANTLVALARHEHVLVRGWSGDGLPTLVRAECFAAGGEAEAAYQQQLQQLSATRVQQPTHPRMSVANLLAAEIAARPNDAQAWRNYADWAWRHADPRGTLVELHEAAEQARSPAHAARIERDIEAHEHAHHGAWRRELIASHRQSLDVGELSFRRGHLLAVSGMPRFELDERAPAAIAELSIELRSINELPALTVTLDRPEWRGLQRFEVRLACTLDDDAGAALIDSLWRSKPRLTTLELRADPGAMTMGPRTLASLGRLLMRHTKVVCGVPLEQLTIDLHDPADGWTLGNVSELIDMLAPSGLRELSLRAPTIPEELIAWSKYSGFSERLARCELRRRIATRPDTRTGIFVTGPAPVAPPRSVQPQDAELSVWADWLQSRGDALGELALLWSLSNEGPADLRREQIARARFKVERELADIEGVLEVDWSGPLIERARLRVRPHPNKDVMAGTLGRVLDSPACARLDELELVAAEPSTLTHLLRLAGSPGRVAHQTLAGLSGLVISCWCRVDPGHVLDALPNLQRFTCRSMNLGTWQHRPHLGLRALTLRVAADLGRRGHGRLFSALAVESLPNLRQLTLELEPRWVGRPLPFERLSLLAEGAHVTIRGNLGEADIDPLARWANAAALGGVEIADAQLPAVQHRLLARARQNPRIRPAGAAN